MRKIAIPTDFSENAWNAIQYAFELFKYDIAEWYLVHAYADAVYEDSAINARAKFEEIREQVQLDTEKSLLELTQKIKEKSPNPKHTVKTMAIFGSLVDVVNDLVESEDIDLVVMGTQGASNKRDLTFGSQTLQVIKYVKSPVLAIPCCFTDIQPKKILFPTNYLVPYRKRELKLLGTLAKNFAATISMLYVSKFEKLSFRQEDNKLLLESCLDGNQLNEIWQKGEDISQVINDHVKNQEIDLLVMVNTRHSYLEHVLHTSKIEKMSLEATIPFLVLQNLPR